MKELKIEQFLNNVYCKIKRGEKKKIIKILRSTLQDK